MDLRGRSFAIIGHLAVLTAAIVSFLTHDFRLPQYLTEVTFDEFIRAFPREPSDHVILLEIDDAAYREQFGDKSPLAKEKVKEIVRRVLAGGAAVVGVDIDTSEWHQECRDLGQKVVCGQVNAGKGDGATEYADLGIAPWRLEKVENEATFLPRNETGVVRVHPPKHPRSFSDEVSKQFCVGRTDCPPGARSDDFNSAYIGFVARRTCEKQPCQVGPNFATFPVRSLFPERQGGKDLEAVLRSQLPFQEKIVILGGTATKLGDRHLTPFGMEAGMELQAEMISSRLASPIQPLSRLQIFFVDLFTGEFILGLQTVSTWFLRRRWPQVELWIIAIVKVLILMTALLSLAYLAYLSFLLSQTLFSFFVVGLGLLFHDWLGTHIELAHEKGAGGQHLPPSAVAENADQNSQVAASIQASTQDQSR
jgi:hypothetical protein